MSELTPDMAAALAAPFPDSEIKSYQEQGMTFRYIDARQAMQRLDEAVGPGNWTTAFRVIDPERWAIECQLTVCGLTRADVGYANSQNSSFEKEPLKGAYSDALKRAAVQFGVGRHLYDKPGRGNPTHLPTSGLLDVARQAGARVTSINGQPVQQEPPATSGRMPAAPNHMASRPENRPVLPATEPQIRAIFAVARGAQGMDDAGVEARCQELYGVKGPSELSRRQASELIDMLKGGAQ